MLKAKRILSIAMAFSFCFSLLNIGSVKAAEVSLAEASTTPIYLDTSYSFEERAADLVSRMTLAEKASQMNSNSAPAIPRLGIAANTWWNEALHGVSYNGTGSYTNTTSYPTDLTLGSSWDPELIYREATMISDEAREVAPNNSRGLDFWSPTMNMARDPRWGRNDESYGEDPYLTTQLASQFVNGMEGKDMNGQLLTKYNKTITTLKHYAANNSEVNRLNGNSVMDERTLREYYTSAFKGIVQKSDVGSVMSSYNSINGIPSPVNVHLNDTLLRQTWGFNGYMTSDCDAVMEVSAGHNWIPDGWTRAVNQIERAAFAVCAGEDLNCNSGYSDGQNYGNTIPTAVSQNITTETGKFTENDVDTSLVRLFTARMKLGEFDDPSNVSWITSARERVPQGTWTNSNSNNAVTETTERLDMAKEVGEKSIVLLKNNETTKKDGSTGKLLPVNVPASGNYNVAVIGYFANPNSIYLGGYSSAQGAAGTAKEINAYNGIKNAVTAINPNAAVTYYKGFTDTGTSASSLNTVDPAAITAARDADLVIVYAGTDSGTAGESSDRRNISLPGAQASLIQQVGQANPNTIAVLETVGQVDVTSFEPSVSAMVWSCFNGERKGDALADVLLGKYNPSGRLPFIWYQSNSQIPDITDYTLRSTDTNPGRTYMYFKGPLEYPFGYGLSYTNFSYSNLKIDNKSLTPSDTFNVSVDVTNDGNTAGNEIVELYINTPDANAALQRPIKRLEGFQKVFLNAGETKTVNMSVKAADLAFFDEAQNKYVVDIGRYGIQISNSSADSDIQLQDFVQITGSLKPILNVVTVKPAQEGDQVLDIPQRVIFDKNKVVIPQITVAMNDETLYGYIEKGKSKSLPEGMTIAYTSNRPSVVSVDDKGVIKTVGGGVATITAAVTYEGVSKSADFVVYVNAKGYLDGINIDGKPLDGFAKDRFNYSVCIPYDTDTVPEVKAICSDPDVSVTVTKPASLPGVATIVTKDGSFSQTYRIGLGRPPVSTDFTTGSLDSHWSIQNEDSTNYQFISNGLQIATQAGDIADNSMKNLFLQQAAGDWAVQTKVNLSAAPSANYQQAGLVVLDDNSNYLKLDYERNGNSNVFRFYNISNNNTTQVGTATSANQTNLYFRLYKKGSTYTAFYSTNGTSFTSLGSTTVNYAYPRLGLVASNGTGSTAPAINAAFAYLKVYDIALTTPAASSITVDGKPLEGFNPSVTNYSVVVTRDQTEVPVVEGIAANSAMNVVVTPADSLPGVTVVKVSTDFGSITYNITIGYSPVSDNFINGTMDSEWTILNPDTANYSLDPGKGLRLRTLNGDIYSNGNAWKNVFVRPAAGDWDIVTKVYYPAAPSATYQQIAMLAWQDDNNYVKLDCEYSGGIKIQLGKEKNGSFSSARTDSVTAAADGSLTLYYRLIKTGSTYEGLYSTDGTNYKSLGTTNIDLTNTKMGLFACKNNASSPEIDTYCEYVKVRLPRTIDSLVPAEAITKAGTAPVLPLTVQALNSDDTTSQVSVIWDEIDPALYARSGSFTVYGTVEGTALRAAANVTVERNLVLEPIGSKTIDENRTLEFTILGVDSDGGTVTYNTEGLPEGASFNTETGEFTWTPSYTQSGDYTVHLTASIADLTASEDITITVNNVLPGDQVKTLKVVITNIKINNGIKCSLITKLDNVLSSIKDKDNAVNILNAFINEVEDLKIEGNLTENQAGELINSAEEIILNINSSK